MAQRCYGCVQNILFFSIFSSFSICFSESKCINIYGLKINTIRPINCGERKKREKREKRKRKRKNIFSLEASFKLINLNTFSVQSR